MGGVAVLIARLSLKVKVNPLALVIRLSFFFLGKPKVIFKNKKQIKSEIQIFWATIWPQFVFVLIRVETEQPIMICLSNSTGLAQNTALHKLFVFLFFLH